MCAQEIKKKSIVSEVEHVPEQLYEEILDFICFLKTKALRENIATAIASESALKKDWLEAKEDDAWRDL